MDSKDLIIIAGSIFFALIVAHGLWVARRGRMNDIQMDLDASLSDGDGSSSDPVRSPELPSGGARVISRALEAESKPAPDSAESNNEYQSDPGSSLPEAGNSEPFVSPSGSKQKKREPLTDDLFAATPSAVPQESPATPGASSSSRRNEAKREPKLEELLILGVMAKRGSTFGGEALIEALRAQGLKFGDMGIFHRQTGESGERLYSVANAVEPGTFDLSDLELLQTPGLTFFMQLPVPGDALETLDEMILSARAVAATLGGDVRDDTMSALTGQTVEHMKQRIADFVRKQLTNPNNH